jgi:putative cardiolipin synthase
LGRLRIACTLAFVKRALVYIFLLPWLALAGCASLPPGADHPRVPSTSLAAPLATPLGKQAAQLSRSRPGLSGVRLFPRGVDGLVLRTQMIRAARRSLDVQYYIFVEDYTGKVLLDAVLDAARRGVRVRILVDDLNLHGRPDTRETLAALDHHDNLEMRVFNPFAYRGDNQAVHAVDALLNAPRVNHRMHNKLMVADNAVALVGGRNVADDYFEVGSAPKRFGDFDLAVVGPVVPEFSKSFDAFWNSSLSIPLAALDRVPHHKLAAAAREVEDNAARDMPDLARRIDSGELLSALMSGRLSMAWGRARAVADPPGKAENNAGDGSDSPTAQVLADELRTVQRELVAISPYVVPGDDGLAVLRDLRERNVRVRILTNSLASTDVPVVHAAYRKYREPLVDAGVELFEVRPAPGQLHDRKGLGSAASGAPFALHAKAYVFDRSSVLIGSANLDPRSLALNTESGILIESPELAAQVVARFEEFAAGANSYHVRHDGTALEWRANVDGREIAWSVEPETTAEQRLRIDMLSILPIDSLL